MKDFLKNIEKTRNTEQQLDYFRKLSDFIESVDSSMIRKMSHFPLYSSRQTITRLIELYEIFKLCRNIPGNILECGTGGGFGLMTFAHLSSIFEPYHFTRRIVGFDTFEGFPGISKKDRTSKAKQMKKGGLNFGSYEVLQKSIELYDSNRALGHIAKVELIKGDISETFPVYLQNTPSLVIALLFMDVDLYKPTLNTLKLAVHRMPRGSIIAFDELNHPDYPGETIAAMEAVGINNLRLRRMEISSTLSYAVLE